MRAKRSAKGNTPDAGHDTEKSVQFQKNNKRLYQDDNSSEDEDEGYLAPLVCSDDDEDAGGDRNAVGNDANKENSSKERLTPLQKARKRRRSSARFLRLSGKFDPVDENGDADKDRHDQEELAEMYRKTIRMNAENRINAGNSWNLHLIDNIDKFLVDDDDIGNGKYDSSSRRQSRGGKSRKHNDTPKKVRRVNFTKASCALDASVKIYSYRVDDAHLSSYKVLANLNRTDSGKNNEDDSESNKATSNPSAVGERKQSERRGGAETLETFVENININSLEQDYDIDPLFHKMSKTFDEGGAKGLLLVNLAVSTESCHIVFDSQEDSDVQPTEDGTETMNDDVNISSLSSKLSSLLNGSPMSSLQLVPQLLSLREEYATLDAEGFVNDRAVSKSNRYANTQEEEAEAEECIHREALERSRMSVGATFLAGNLSYFSQGNFSMDASVSFITPGDEFGANFNGGDYDDVDHNDITFSDLAMTNGPDESFVAPLDSTFLQESSHGNFLQESSQNNFLRESILHNSRKSVNSNMLDAIFDSGAMASNGSYDYFNMVALEKMTTGNMWAGFSHWKKSSKISRKKTKESSSENKTARKKTCKAPTLIDIHSISSLDDALAIPKTKRGGANPLLLTLGMKQKLGRKDNLLPFDAELGIDQLSRLFLRPTAMIREPVDDCPTKKKVGFVDTEPVAEFMFDGGGDFADDDGGAGYDETPWSNNFDEVDDYQVKDLDGIRKVDKVHVGYATVAKKVDVRRLKKDLWYNLESRINEDTKVTIPEEKESSVINDPYAMKEREQINMKDGGVDLENPLKNEIISFKETVHDLESNQAQGDVSLPFYFICILHLANEKCLKLDSSSCEALSDFIISVDDGSVPETEPEVEESTIATQRKKRTVKNKKKITIDESDEDGEEDEDEYMD